MNRFFFVIVLLHLSSATATNLNQVFEWPKGLDYEWPFDWFRLVEWKLLRTFKPEDISPQYMAVHGPMIFLSLNKTDGIQATLVHFLRPTIDDSSASPKLRPFPSWTIQRGIIEGCDKIYAAKGLQVDSVGRLWVLDDGSKNCEAKLWIIDLNNISYPKFIHLFSFHGLLHDLVLDETPNGTLAYISRWREQHIVVFSLEKNESWMVETPGIVAYSIALSPKEEPRKLYLGKRDSNELYSISVAALRSGNRTANPELIGNWTAANSYRMLMDKSGTMYAAFLGINYILSWKSSEPLEEQQRFLEFEKLNTKWPFTFALDSSETFWMTELNKTATKPSCKLLTAGNWHTDDLHSLYVFAFLLVSALVLICCCIIFGINICRKIYVKFQRRCEMSTVQNHVSPEIETARVYLLPPTLDHTAF